MKTNWEKYDGNQCEYVRVDDHQVIRGSHSGSGHTDNAGTASYEDFLKGNYQDSIRSTFGEEVLQEVIYAVKHAFSYAPWNERREGRSKLVAYLEKVPEKAGLLKLVKKKETENGYRNYGNAKGYKSVVESDKLTLIIEKQNGTLVFKNRVLANMDRNFSLQGHASGMVAHKDHFYIIHSNQFAEISPQGEILFNTWDGVDANVFGADLRLNNVFRYQDRIFVSWWWVSSTYPNGILEYKSGEGWVGRSPVV